MSLINMARFRYNFTESAPSWITTGDGKLVQYTHGRVLDTFLERVRQSALSRFPGVTETDGTLSLIGETRNLSQGLSEPDDRFQARLGEWLEPHSLKAKGAYYPFLTQMHAVLGMPVGALVKLVTRNGFIAAWDGASFTTDETFNAATSTNNGFWVGAGAPSLDAGLWAYAYVVVENYASWSLPTTLLIGDPALWGGALGTTDEVLGLGGAKFSQLIDLRDFVREWFPLGVTPVALLFNAAAASPFPETGIDTGSEDAPNYTALVPSNLVVIDL